MAESDDEYDRKRRDKFRGERGAGPADTGYRERRDDRRRDDWPPERARGGRTGPDYRDYRGVANTRGYSPVRGEPPGKRMRPDWPMDDRRYGGMPHDSYGSYGWGHDHFGPHPAHQGYGHHMPAAPVREVPGVSAADSAAGMMSFKAFLAAQDDSITVDDAINKYNEYKLEFRRQQLNEFFIAHKDEEWFKIKYHPEESVKRKEEQLASLKNRLNVFLELLHSGELDKVTVDVEKSTQLIRLLDTVVIKLEGGTDEDLLILDEPQQREGADKSDKTDAGKPIVIDIDNVLVKQEKDDTNKEKEASEDSEKPSSPKPPAPITMDIDPHHRELQEQAKIFSRFNSSGEPIVDQPAESEPEKEPPAPGGSSSSSSSSGSSSSSSEDEAVEAPSGKKSPTKSPIQAKSKSKSPSVDKEIAHDERNGTDSAGDKEKTVEEVAEKKEIRALHKTTSIFLRNLAPSITKAEVEAMCKRYGGFLRVALADPLPERRWFRRGWVTFRREVNIKDICWNLNNIRLRECELGAIVNRDLQRRIRSVSGVTLEKAVLRADARLAARLAHHLDTRSNLWKDADAPADDNQETFSLQSNNPVLHKITEHLIEEASTEEDELLGLEVSTADNSEPETADTELMRVLDRLVLYLRIVHSVDYYNHCEYPYEDEMPNRCGIMHARSAQPNKASQQEIQDYIKSFEGKMSAFLQDVKPLTMEELQKLGIKDPEEEVEKFVQSNTQELAKDKWLCPLSGKKFKGPDFIRKHIFNKHAEKVEEVRREVAYFNAYLRDQRRPHPPDPPQRNVPAHAAPPVQHAPYSGAGGPGAGGPGARAWGGWGGGWAPPAVHYPPRPRFTRPRGGGSDMRPVIHYRDLDAPREPDDFI